MTASFDSAFAFARFFASIAFCSAAGSFLLTNLDTLARLAATSFPRLAPDRRFFRISCCASHVVSRPPTSLLFRRKSNGPARAIARARRRRTTTGAARGDVFRPIMSSSRRVVTRALRIQTNSRHHGVATTRARARATRPRVQPRARPPPCSRASEAPAPSPSAPRARATAPAPRRAPPVARPARPGR